MKNANGSAVVIPVRCGVLNTGQTKKCNEFVSTEVGEVTGGRETQLTFRDTR